MPWRSRALPTTFQKWLVGSMATTSGPSPSCSRSASPRATRRSAPEASVRIRIVPRRRRSMAETNITTLSRLPRSTPAMSASAGRRCRRRASFSDRRRMPRVTCMSGCPPRVVGSNNPTLPGSWTAPRVDPTRVGPSAQRAAAARGLREALPRPRPELPAKRLARGGATARGSSSKPRTWRSGRSRFSSRFTDLSCSSSSSDTSEMA